MCGYNCTYMYICTGICDGRGHTVHMYVYTVTHELYSAQDFNRPVGVFSQSVFIPDSEQLALTGTSLGCGVVWGPPKKGVLSQV